MKLYFQAKHFKMKCEGSLLYVNAINSSNKCCYFRQLFRKPKWQISVFSSVILETENTCTPAYQIKEMSIFLRVSDCTKFEILNKST